MNLCDFLQLCKYYVNYMQKGQKGANVKAHYEFNNDP
jgi:hypothetical protein